MIECPTRKIECILIVCHFSPFQSGYIDGPILTTFHTNLVILPAVMEYMQYGFIALGLAMIIIASLVHHKLKVKLPPSTKAGDSYHVS